MAQKQQRKPKMTDSGERHLILGAGEVGQALYLVLSPFFDVSIRDKDGDLQGRFDVLHVAYPPIKNFNAVTKRYIKMYDPSLVIVHSTVPVGATRALGPSAVHSPIRGMHSKEHHPGVVGSVMPTVAGNPEHFAKSLSYFPKYFGGSQAARAAGYFEKAGIVTQIFDMPETTELGKILDTTYYAWNVVFAKEVKEMCDALELNFDDVYTIPNQHYNESYAKLGKNHVVRPVLKHIPGGIGGHCLIPNCGLHDHWLTRIIKARDKKYRAHAAKKAARISNKKHKVL